MIDVLTAVPPQTCLLGMALLTVGCWLADRIGGSR